MGRVCRIDGAEREKNQGEEMNRRQRKKLYKKRSKLPFRREQMRLAFGETFDPIWKPAIYKQLGIPYDIPQIIIEHARRQIEIDNIQRQWAKLPTQ